MTGVLAYLVLAIVIPALLLGHHGQDFPPFRWWRAHRAQRTAAPQPPGTARRPVPSWAHTQPVDYKEAA